MVLFCVTAGSVQTRVNIKKHQHQHTRKFEVKRSLRFSIPTPGGQGNCPSLPEPHDAAEPSEGGVRGEGGVMRETAGRRREMKTKDSQLRDSDDWGGGGTVSRVAHNPATEDLKDRGLYYSRDGAFVHPYKVSMFTETVYTPVFFHS